mmetsp:Transcript_1500/g.5304  ORF Transcript_1500/g.5304 Transcript_1500/m.5304 type:complete len:255 (+) Transcript_1500:95-859(+)
MDADEEQVMELEGLEGIYADDFQQTSDKPPRAFTIRLAPMQEELPPSDSDDDEQELLDGEDFAISMSVVLPQDYPEVSLPELTLTPLCFAISEADTEQLQEELMELAAENAGMAMIFVLGSRVQEWLEEERERQAAARRLAKRDPALDEVLKLEEARKHGTPVTRENFLAWKERFDAEMRAANAEKELLAHEALEAAASSRLTGKQLFQAQPSLALDDAVDDEPTAAAAAAPATAPIAADQSLFADDLDDEDFE